MARRRAAGARSRGFTTERQPAKRGRIYTPAEAKRQLEAVEVLLVQFASAGQVERALKEEFGVGPTRTRTLIKRIEAKWEREFEDDARTRRQKIARSIQRSLAQVEARLAEKGITATAWERLNSLRIKYVDQLMDLTGARAPEEVNVNLNATVNTTLLAVVGTLNAEQVGKLRERRRSREMQGEVVQAPALPPYTSGSAE